MIKIALVPDPLNELGDVNYQVIENAILGTFIVEYAPTGIADFDLANGIRIEAYPNPFTDFTAISFIIPVTGEVTLDIYNMYGSRVETLVDEIKDSGLYTVKFNAIQCTIELFF